MSEKEDSRFVQPGVGSAADAAHTHTHTPPHPPPVWRHQEEVQRDGEG